MAFSSFAPIRRFNISSRPTFVSNDHLPLRFTIGMGSGKSSLPTRRMARFGSLLSISTEFFSFALSANASARVLSATGSSELTRSSPSGPRVCLRAETSNVAAAVRRLSTACFGVSNCFCCGCDAAAVDSCFCSGAPCEDRTTKAQLTIAQAITKNFDEVIIFAFDFICVFSPSFFISGLLRHHRGRRHRHHDRRHLHRGSFRRRPCYDRLCCCWLARSFRYRRRQILLRRGKRN